MLKLTPYPRASSGSKAASTASRIGDTLSLAGAEELARRIKDYWHGHDIGVRVETVSKVHGESAGWCVRSNLRNGMPPA